MRTLGFLLATAFMLALLKVALQVALAVLGLGLLAVAVKAPRATLGFMTGITLLSAFVQHPIPGLIALATICFLAGMLRTGGNKR